MHIFFLPSSAPLSLLFKQNFLLYCKTGLFISFRTTSSSLGPGLGENTKCRVTDLRPARKSLTPKLIPSKIPTSGSGKGEREVRGPAAFHRSPESLRWFRFQGHLKPNSLGSGPSSATRLSVNASLNFFSSLGLSLQSAKCGD